MERVWKREIISKECIVSGKVALQWGTKGVYWVDYLTSSDQEIPG